MSSSLKNSKDAPIFENGASWVAYESKIKNWCLFTDLAKSKRVPYLIGVGIQDVIAKREAEAAINKAVESNTNYNIIQTIEYVTVIDIYITHCIVDDVSNTYHNII